MDIIKQWELDTGYNMEFAYYKSTHSSSVNAYFAVKTDGKIKRKGVYAEFEIDKNASNVICSEAVAQFLKTGVDTIADYIRGSKDIRKFMHISKVAGGGVKDGVYLGKTIRFYHSTSTHTGILYANSGNKVGMTESCRPLMYIPDPTVFPEDLDYDWYINRCYVILKDIGYPLDE